MAHEVCFYAIVQKEGLGFDKAVEEAKARMARYSVKPNMLVVPPQLLLYMATAPTEKIRFSDAGPDGPARFEAGVDGYEARSFRGLGIFTSTPFEVSDDADSLQMLQRSTQVGEFYRMSPPHVWDTSAGKKLPPHYMDIVIYDEEHDKHVHITLREALLHAGIDDTQFATGGGPPPDVFGIAKVSETAVQNVLRTVSGLPSGSAMKTVTDPAVIRTGLGQLLGPGKIWTKGATADIVQFVEAGVWLPIEVIIARPFIEHLMMSAVMTVAGRDTGATLFGPADMQISANTSVKTIEGHYTCHTKSVITKPQNVLVMRDIMCSGYVAGGNTSFFGSKYNGADGFPSLEARIRSITERLSFVDDASGEYESMLAFACPWEANSKRDQVMSLSARLLPWEVTRSDPMKQYFPGGNDGWALYGDKYALSQIHFGEDIRAAENMEFISQGSVNNALCFIGPHRVYSAWSSTFQELVPGQGHFGPDALPGDARWRRGESVSLEQSRNAMVGIEAAAHSQLVFQRPS